MSAIPEGYVAIPGRSPEKALKLLAAADAAGVDQTLIRSYPFTDEYHVPEAAADAYNDQNDDLTEEEIAAIRAPRPWVPHIENLSTEETANSDGTSGSDGTHAGSEDGVKRDDEGGADEEQVENPKPAKSASKGDWLDYAVSIEEARFEPSEEAAEFDREAERKRLDDELTKEQLVTTYGA